RGRLELKADSSIYANDPIRQFWHDTWLAWRSGVLEPLLPQTVTVSSVPFEEFFASSRDVRHPALTSFIVRFQPQFGEFLVGYDGRLDRDTSFVLTNTRLFVKDAESAGYVAVELRDIQGVHVDGRWRKTYTITTRHGARIFRSLLAVPNGSVVRFAI